MSEEREKEKKKKKNLLVVGHCYAWQVQVLLSVKKSNIICHGHFFVFLAFPCFAYITITSSSDARSQPQRHFEHDIMPASGIVAWTLSVFFVLFILVATAFARYHTRILVITNDA
jgi:hypothetical protein